jgi:hypothetical protein
MMLALLMYAYCCGVYSSRKNAAATYDIIPFRLLTLDPTIPVRDARSASIGARAAEPRQCPSLPASCSKGLCGTGS